MLQYMYVCIFSVLKIVFARNIIFFSMYARLIPIWTTKESILSYPGTERFFDLGEVVSVQLLSENRISTKKNLICSEIMT